MFELTRKQKQIADLLLSGEKVIILSGRKLGKTAIAKHIEELKIEKTRFHNKDPIK